MDDVMMFLLVGFALCTWGFSVFLVWCINKLNSLIHESIIPILQQDSDHETINEFNSTITPNITEWIYQSKWFGILFAIVLLFNIYTWMVIDTLAIQFPTLLALANSSVFIIGFVLYNRTTYILETYKKLLEVVNS